MTSSSCIRVAAESPYDVVVGTGIVRKVADAVPASARRVAVIHSTEQASVAIAVRELLSGRFDPVPLAVADGEDAKTARVADACWQHLAQHGFTRSDAVVAVGGGAITDLAGFVAATFLRGLPVVCVPTSLLGMVDAAVGGKTGINLPEGKNLVGAFHEPTAVLCDLDTLATLPSAEIASGLAEVVKCGFIADSAILDLIRRDPRAATDVRSSALRELVERAIRVKAAIVSSDLREAGHQTGTVGREALNYGHTLGHAIEQLESYTVRHGAAVAIGMVYAAELAGLAGRLDADTVRSHRDVLASIGLPTGYTGATWAPVRDAMRVDKKARGDRLRFVILEAVARPLIYEAPEENLLAEAYRRIGAGSTG